jgi:hypothetical protein
MGIVFVSPNQTPPKEIISCGFGCWDLMTEKKFQKVIPLAEVK